MARLFIIHQYIFDEIAVYDQDVSNVCLMKDLLHRLIMSYYLADESRVA